MCVCGLMHTGMVLNHEGGSRMNRIISLSLKTDLTLDELSTKFL